MVKKYAGKAVVLPQQTSLALERVQKDVEKKIGFKPSLSETVQFLIKSYDESIADGSAGGAR